MIKVGILGAGGYVASELLRLLFLHPEVEITYLVSETFEGENIGKAHPRLNKRSNLKFSSYRFKDARNCDLLFITKPHTYFTRIADLISDGVKVIDLGPDFRLRDKEEFERWYKIEHKSPSLLSESVYGLPEINGQKIREAKLVANPGCYSTAVLLAVAPLISNLPLTTYRLPLIEKEIIANSVSGFSGAGRKESENSLALEVVNNLKPYKVGVHRHTPEIEQELKRISQKEFKLTFVPHCAGFERGILTTLYLRLKEEVGFSDIFNLYNQFYKERPFIRLYPKGEYPEIKNVIYTNFCDLGLRVDPDRKILIVISAMDNLVKGASGQAIQNMNLLFDLPETTGLL